MFTRAIRAATKASARRPVVSKALFAPSFAASQPSAARAMPLMGVLAGRSFSKTTLTKPTLEDARAMPREHFEMDNATLMALAIEGDHGAHEERLRREIMSVNSVSWDEAEPKMKEIHARTMEGLFIATLPYKVGLTVAFTGGLLSIPLVFHLETAMWFNSHFVTTDVPDPKDLETCLEVGAWTWNWMEPPLGQISFFLLTLQFARAQMLNMGLRPYTSWIKKHRALQLHAQFPEYNKKIIQEFSKSSKLL